MLKDHHAEQTGEQIIPLAPACFFLISFTSCSQASRYIKPSGCAFLRLSVCMCVCARVHGNPISVGLHACLLILTFLGPRQFTQVLLSTFRINYLHSQLFILPCLIQFQVLQLHFHANQETYITRCGLSPIPPTCEHRWVHFLKFT